MNHRALRMGGQDGGKIVMLDYMQTIATMVAQQLGDDRPDLAARATWNAYLLSLIYTGVMALLYVAVPDLFLLGHASGLDASRFAELRDVVVVLLRPMLALDQTSWWQDSLLLPHVLLFEDWFRDLAQLLREFLATLWQ